VERLALHAFQAELWNKAVGYLRRAGLKADHRSAHREAVVAFEKALVALTHLHSPDTLQQAIDIRLDLRSSLNPLGDMTRLHNHLREAEILAKDLGDKRRLARVAAFMTQTWAVLGDHRAAVQSGQRALNIAIALDDLELRVFANYFLHQSYHFTGEYRHAIDGLRWNIASLEGDLLYERFGSSTYPSVVSRAGMATCLAELGEFPEAAAHGEAAVRIAEAVGHPYSLIHASWSVSAGHLLRGDVQRAVSLLERAASLCRRRDIPRPLYQTTVFLGFGYALGGRLEEALPQLELAEALQKTWGTTATWTRWLAEAYWLVGRVEHAARIADGALALSCETKERGNQAWLLRLLGELDIQRDPRAFSRAEGHYQQARAIASHLGMRPLIAHCHLGLGKLYRRVGKREEAEEHLTTATTMYREMEMRFWLEQAEAEMRAFG
jgi:tetratricopeptide (TPR) repeat protein